MQVAADDYARLFAQPALLNDRPCCPCTAYRVLTVISTDSPAKSSAPWTRTVTANARFSPNAMVITGRYR